MRLSAGDTLRLFTLWPAPLGMPISLTRTGGRLRVSSSQRPVRMSVQRLALLDLNMRVNSHLVLGPEQVLGLRGQYSLTLDQEREVQRALMVDPLFASLFEACKDVGPHRYISLPPPPRLSADALTLLHVAFDHAALLRLSRTPGQPWDLRAYSTKGEEQPLNYNLLLDLAGPPQLTPPSRADYGVNPFPASRTFGRLLTEGPLLAPILTSLDTLPTQVLLPLPLAHR